MAAVLGISAHYHDAAAAIVVGGEVIAAAHEERFSRVLGDPSLPLRAARFCLGRAGLGPGDLDAVVFYELPFAKLERLLVGSLRAFPRGAGGFVRALRSQLSEKIWVLDDLAERLDVPRSRVFAVSHHDSHAASAFFPSPYEDAAVLTVDGAGEHTTTAIWRGRGRELEPWWSQDLPHSLGLFYAAITAFCGFEVNRGEQKTMGLAAFGAPRFEAELRRVLRISGDGSFELDPRFVDVTGDRDEAFCPALVGLLGPPRPYGAPWRLEGPDGRFADVAASAQALLEEAMLGLARRARSETGSSNLCLAGGVALNCVANARIAREAGFDGVFVQPAAGDAGGALGAAILGALSLGDPRPAPMRSAALGQPIDAGAGRALAQALGLRVSAPPRIADEIGRRLAEGEVIASAAGRCELGPRALGQRSLLAPAHDRRFRETINRTIKGREPFRPFAPSMASEGAVLLQSEREMTRFMTTVCPIAPSDADELEATLHVDGTARLHAVDADGAPELSDVLAAYTGACGRKAVLHTSLNAAGEPIVGSAEDAVLFFASHPGVDVLRIEDLLIERPA